MAEKKPIFRFLLLKIREAGYKLFENQEEWKKLLEEDLADCTIRFRATTQKTLTE